MMIEVAVGARIVKTEPRMNSKVHVEIEVTAPGPFGTAWTLPFLVDDQGGRDQDGTGRVSGVGAALRGSQVCCSVSDFVAIRKGDDEDGQLSHRFTIP
jgi:hypothetical protein